jgi:hypothetical protein
LYYWSCSKIDRKQYQKEYYQKHCYEIRQQQSVYRQFHHDEKIKRDTAYRKNYPEKISNFQKRFNRKQKLKVVAHYSSNTMKCVMCGISDIRVLSMDHVLGNGCTHRKEIKTASIYWWLTKNNYPSGFQVLCMNCQFIKRSNRNENHKRNSKVTLQTFLGDNKVASN